VFDWGLARNTDPATSHEAAESIDATRLEMIVLEEFKKAPKGLTAEELSDRLPGIPLNTLTPRLAPLKNKGYLQPIGKRKARSGRNQTVLGWIDE
jgi:Fic family protein